MTMKTINDWINCSITINVPPLPIMLLPAVTPSLAQFQFVVLEALLASQWKHSEEASQFIYGSSKENNPPDSYFPSAATGGDASPLPWTLHWQLSGSHLHNWPTTWEPPRRETTTGCFYRILARGRREEKKGRIKKKPKSEESGMTAEDRRRRENRVGGDGGRACNPGEFNPAGHWKSKPGCSLGRRQSHHIVCQHWDNPGGWDNKSGPKCSCRPRIFYLFIYFFVYS